MKSFFNADNFIFRWSLRIFDTAVLSLLFLLCCLPVVTIGPATTALYYGVVKCVRFKQPEPWRNFFSSFRENLRVGILYTLVYMGFGLLLFFVAMLVLGMVPMEQALGSPVMWGFVLLGVFFFAAFQCGTVLLSRFGYTLSGLLLDSLRITFAHLPRVLLAGVVGIAVLGLSIKYLYYQVWFVTPALTQLMVSVFMEPVLRKYVPDMEELMKLPLEERPWYLQ